MGENYKSDTHQQVLGWSQCLHSATAGKPTPSPPPKTREEIEIQAEWSVTNTEVGWGIRRTADIHYSSQNKWQSEQREVINYCQNTVWALQGIATQVYTSVHRYTIHRYTLVYTGSNFRTDDQHCLHHLHSLMNARKLMQVNWVIKASYVNHICNYFDFMGTNMQQQKCLYAYSSFMLLVLWTTLE